MNLVAALISYLILMTARVPWWPPLKFFLYWGALTAVIQLFWEVGRQRSGLPLLGEPELSTRRQIGIGLRFPVIAVLTYLWIVSVWWWLAAAGIGLALLRLVGKPLAYPLLWLFVELSLAFANSREPVLPHYWTGYPDYELTLAKKSAKVGFPTLKSWLINGWTTPVSPPQPGSRDQISLVWWLVIAALGLFALRSLLRQNQNPSGSIPVVVQPGPQSGSGAELVASLTVANVDPHSDLFFVDGVRQNGTRVDNLSVGQDHLVEVERVGCGVFSETVKLTQGKLAHVSARFHCDSSGTPAFAGPEPSGPDSSTSRSGLSKLTGEPLLVDQVDEPVRIIRIPKPSYPPALQQAGIDGSVVAQYVVDTLGRAEPLSWKVLESTRPQFENPAREAIMRGSFKPARNKGRAVRQLIQQTIRFAIGN